VLGDERSCLSPTFEIQLCENRADIVLDGLVGQEDLACDLLVRLAFGDEEQDLALLGREPRELVLRLAAGDLPDALEYPFGDRRIEQ
jgi:hypothetical protein